MTYIFYYYEIMLWIVIKTESFYCSFKESLYIFDTQKKSSLCKIIVNCL